MKCFLTGWEVSLRLLTLSLRLRYFLEAPERVSLFPSEGCRRALLLSGELLNDDEIETSVQESDLVDDETDEDENNNNESNKGASNADALAVL
ncbi:hypothetical protein TNCV_3289721 [Trichonephila clavipes]|nr:hypothetical protein TNCV_3289721 [Trichonephila clavipes]